MSVLILEVNDAIVERWEEIVKQAGCLVVAAAETPEPHESGAAQFGVTLPVSKIVSASQAEVEVFIDCSPEISSTGKYCVIFSHWGKGTRSLVFALIHMLIASGCTIQIRNRQSELFWKGLTLYLFDKPSKKPEINSIINNLTHRWTSASVENQEDFNAFSRYVRYSMFGLKRSEVILGPALIHEKCCIGGFFAVRDSDAMIDSLTWAGIRNLMRQLNARIIGESVASTQ